MTAVDFSAPAVTPLLSGSNALGEGAPAASGTATAPATGTAAPSEGGITFGDVLDIVNPLQHLPVIGTLYRAITGDQIKTFPKIAGDTLYGGVMGFAGSIADTVFEKITGHSFGDTVLAEVEDVFGIKTGADAPATGLASNAPIDTTATPVASDAPQLTAPAVVADASLETLVVPGQEALVNALHRAGVGRDVAVRATDAYRRTIGVAHAAVNTAVAAPELRATIAQ